MHPKEETLRFLLKQEDKIHKKRIRLQRDRERSQVIHNAVQNLKVFEKIYFILRWSEEYNPGSTLIIYKNYTDDILKHTTINIIMLIGA